MIVCNSVARVFVTLTPLWMYIRWKSIYILNYSYIKVNVNDQTYSFLVRVGVEVKMDHKIEEIVYTLGVWRVKPGQEEAFIQAWKGLGEIFAQLPLAPDGQGTLIQSINDPTLFYSFGSWKSLADIQAMRNSPQAQEGIERLRALCTEATPGSFRLVATA